MSLATRLLETSVSGAIGTIAPEGFGVSLRRKLDTEGFPASVEQQGDGVYMITAEMDGHRTASQEIRKIIAMLRGTGMFSGVSATVKGNQIHMVARPK